MANDGQIRGQEVINDDVFQRLERFASILDEIILKFDSAEKKGRTASNSISFADAEKENAEAVKQSKKALSEYERIQRQLEKQEERRVTSQTRLARRLAEQRVETQRLNRETKRNAVINNENERAYKRLSALYAKQKDDLKDLVILYGQNSNEVREFAREVEKTGSKIKAADNVTGDFRRNVGNYPSALKPAITAVKQLAASFGIIEAARFANRLISDLSRMAREAKGVEFAFDRLGRQGGESFDNIQKKTRGLFSELEIKQAIVEFDNFRLSGEQLGTIFEFIAVRAAQTGQSFEYLRNSAIEAITKESVLRADNLGISQKALNEELEKGVDFLTAFGNVAQREIDRAGNILEDANNGAQKFNASLDNLKLTLGQTFTDIGGFSLFADYVSRIDEQIKQINYSLSENIDLSQRLGFIIRTLTGSGLAQNRALIEEAEARKRVEQELQAQIKAERKLYEQRQGFVGPKSEENQDNSGGGFSILGNIGQTVNQRIEELNTKLDEYRDKLGKTVKTDKSAIEAIRTKINELTRERDALTDLFDVQQKTTKATEKFIKTFDLDTEEGLTSAISLLEEQQKKLVLGGDEWQELGKQVENYRKLLKKLKQEANFSVEGITFIDGDAAQDALDVKNFLDTEGIEQGMKTLSETLGIEQSQLVDEFEKYYKKDFENFQKYALQKAEAEKELEFVRRQALVDGLGVAQDFAQAFYEIQSDRIDEEIEKQNEAFDNIINNKNSSEEAIAIAEKKREENEKRLEKEKEKRQRRAFLIQQGIEVAKAIIAGENAALAALTLPPIGLGPIAGKPFAIAARLNAKLAIASILAQTIPQFYRGKEAANNYEGIASVNEMPGQREYRVNKDGVIEMFPAGMQYTYVKKDDIIEKSGSSLKSSLQDRNSEVFKRVVGSKYSNDTQERMRVVYAGSQSDSGLKDELVKMNRLLRKYSQRPMNVTANVTIDKPRKYFSA